MKLIGSTSSPYVRKVRIVMAEKKLDYEFVFEDVWVRSKTLPVVTDTSAEWAIWCLRQNAAWT